MDAHARITPASLSRLRRDRCDGGETRGGVRADAAVLEDAPALVTLVRDARDVVPERERRSSRHRGIVVAVGGTFDPAVALPHAVRPFRVGAVAAPDVQR